MFRLHGPRVAERRRPRRSVAPPTDVLVGAEASDDEVIDWFEPFLVSVFGTVF